MRRHRRHDSSIRTAGGKPTPSTLRSRPDSAHERTRQAVADAVDEALTGAGVEVRSAESVGRQEAATGGHLAPILVILLATALPDPHRLDHHGMAESVRCREPGYGSHRQS
jgi:hypothetical protein